MSAAWVPSQNQKGTNLSNLTNPRHANAILLNLNGLRRNPYLCDGVIQLKDGDVKVQRSILAAASPYFRGLYTFDVTSSVNTVENEKSKETETMKQIDARIEELSCEVFEHILEYIYTSEMVLCEENIQEMLQAADLLLMEDLKALCCEYLEQCITVNNCIGIREFTEQFSCPRVHHLASSFLDEHFMEVSMSEEFLELSLEKLKRLLSRDTIMIFNEAAVFDCVRRWTNFQLEERKCWLEQLVKECVHVGLLEERFVQEQVIADPLIRSLGLEGVVQQLRSVQAPRQRGYCNMLVATGGEGPCETDNLTVEIKHSTKCMSIKRNQRQTTSIWLDLANMNESRVGHGMVEAGGFLYAIGGRNDAGRILNSGEKYDPLSNTWTLIPPMNHARVGFGLVSIDDRIYAIGGSNDMSDPITSMEEFDIYANRWRMLPDMNLKRAWSAHAVCNKKIYVIGGGVMGKLYEAVECFDPKTESWVSVAPMKERRFDAKAVGIGNNVYVFGGLRRLECPSAAMHSSTGMKFCGTEIFNTETKTWSIGERIQGLSTMTDSSRLDSVLVCGEDILVVGLLVSGSQQQCVKAYSPLTNMWKCLAQNHPPYQRGMQAAVLRMPRAMVYQLMWEQNKMTFVEMSASLGTSTSGDDEDANLGGHGLGF